MANNQIITMFSYTPNQFPIIGGGHFDYWSSQMETLFISQNLWEVVEDSYQRPPLNDEESSDAQQTEYKKNLRRDASVLRFIQQGLSKTIYPRIHGVKKAKEAWDILKEGFQANEKVTSIKLQHLCGEFDNLAKKDNEGMQVFLSKVAEIVNHIRSFGDTIDEKKIVQKVLRSLPAKYDYVVAAIEESNDLAVFTFSELSSSLQVHDKRISKSSNQPVEQALESKLSFSRNRNSQMPQRGRGGSFQGRGRGRAQVFVPKNNEKYPVNGCIICGKTNHETKDCLFKCKKCRIPNHSQRHCWHQNQAVEEDANFSKDEGEQLFSCMSVQQRPQNAWYVDSGCSSHMTGDRSSFVELDKTYTSQVKLGDGQLLKTEGKGTIAVQTKEGKRKLISDVLYVPKLTSNLLSVGQLLQKGYSVLFDNEECRIIDKQKNITIATIKMSSSKVFCLVMPSEEKVAYKGESVDQSQLWHLRYGHINNAALQLLKEKNMVVGLPQIESKVELCDGCVYATHRLPFPKNSWRAKEPLEVIHADICGPFRTFSIGNKRYFILFVDDYTRMIWIYFLSEKSEAFSAFLKFKVLVEKQSGREIKILLTDRGGEFIYTPFMEYCKQNGIRRQLIVRRNPQQNGVAEKKNRIIVEMAGSMLIGKGLPKIFWAEAVHTSIYIMNRCPTKAVLNRTPFEAWYKKKPVVDHLKIFGCIAYSHISVQNRDKFDTKGEKLIFIGYSDESKGFRLYNPITSKLVVSRDVIFDEMSSWSWEENSSQPITPYESFEPPIIENEGDVASPPQSPQRNQDPNSEK